jgi:Tol biopolymer transport system component
MTRSHRTASFLVLALAGGIIAVPAGSAAAVVGGPSGQIAFQSERDGDFEIWVANPDGSAPTKLTDNTVVDADPAWSPDGSRIAFQRGGTCTNACRAIWVMNADGSSAAPLTGFTSGVVDSGPTWAPDGSTIAFASTRSGGVKHLFRVPAAGGAVTQLTSGADADWAPDWSPDGLEILFVSTRTGSSQLFTTTPEGSAPSRVVLAGSVPRALIGEPSWSPDGSRIAFRGAADLYAAPTQIFVADADGGATSLAYAPDDATFVYTPVFSPDGARLVVANDTAVAATGFEVESVDLATGLGTPIASAGADDLNPSWGTNTAVLAAAPPPAVTLPADVHVAARDTAFSPASPTVPVGTKIVWDFAGPSAHDVADASSLGLFDSASKGPGTSFAYRYAVAGTYAFRCTDHRKMIGTVSVPIGAAATSGSTSSQITLSWSSLATLPAGSAVDVQVLRPGSRKWALWKSAVTVDSGILTPDAGSGVYAFRARMRKVSTGATSAWSPPLSLTIV